MAKSRELRRRIKSVENTRQITKTMEMVATSRLKRAQDRVVAARPYAEVLADVIAGLYEPGLAERFPILRQPGADRGRVALVFMTSNRGLCGGFNANLIREAQDRMLELESRGREVELHGIGRKGIGYFRYIGRELASARQDIGDHPTPEHASEVIQPLLERFEGGELDAVEVVFAKFNNPLSTPPTRLTILPIVTPTDRLPVNYLLRPSADEILRAILPMYIQNQMYRALVETAASEHGARRTAMKSATDNAGDMIDYLRRTYNRARQAQITQEIAEIVGGAEALKG
ncbi:MAG: ATP synthase F1 subunit gamma [Gemmatimonadota bacterium]|nr:ATP synthase F1 subunit gamma [Gemmatimonadota bacterium]MDH3369606.1 ATP synthase F1 subunit gamma [Gemmatimonadota bacterium]MDH3479471.1 ATP synthase F1 subunit gamma [Gemmatimonadota bacterium]MDH3570848.1 ATP synthase F1 subunit gamma [Gemmatimonadota bacterium]MDH5550381.1 ATP synthase F1 subunit gamma [Gemmatimonadota bacterium]